MGDERRVMPRQALKAERVTSYLGESWSLGFHRTLFTDDEFDAAYIDADLVQAVLDAARHVVLGETTLYDLGQALDAYDA